ncbi:uncharacterized protein BJ212DRAFT_1395224, partial [Suillus subaureus]
MARTCFMLLWVHAAGEVVCFPYFRETLNEDWLRVGIVAMVAFSILIIVFFYVHFLGVLIFLVGGYYHTKVAHGSYWIWPSFVFWAFDRFVRVVRLVVFNHSYFGFKSGAGTMDATTECFPKYRQTAYLIMPSVSTLPFEAHPFTIVSFDSSLLSTARPEDQSGSGFTKKLKEVAGTKGKVKVFVDGPYGPSSDLGGSGIIVYPPGIPERYRARGLVCLLSLMPNYSHRCVRKGKKLLQTVVVFIWSIRGAGCVQWIEEALIKAVQLAPPSLTVSIRIFDTGSPSTSQYMEEDFSLSNPTEKNGTPEQVLTRKVSVSSSMLFSLHGVKMESGRADLDALLKEEVSMASGSMSVSVCGSQGIARAVRHALRFPVSGPSSILSGGPSVTLYVESFGYAD